MTAATFILMYKKPADVAASNEALKFFGWAYDKGADEAKALDYIPMPANVVEKVKKTWAARHRAEVMRDGRRLRAAGPSRIGRKRLDEIGMTSTALETRAGGASAGAGPRPRARPAEGSAIPASAC